MDRPTAAPCPRATAGYAMTTAAHPRPTFVPGTANARASGLPQRTRSTTPLAGTRSVAAAVRSAADEADQLSITREPGNDGPEWPGYTWGVIRLVARNVVALAIAGTPGSRHRGLRNRSGDDAKQRSHQELSDQLPQWNSFPRGGRPSE